MFDDAGGLDHRVAAGGDADLVCYTGLPARSPPHRATDKRIIGCSGCNHGQSVVTNPDSLKTGG